MESISVDPLPDSLIQSFFSFGISEYSILFFAFVLLFISATFFTFGKAFKLLSRNDIAEMKTNASLTDKIIIKLSKKESKIKLSLALLSILFLAAFIILTTLLTVKFAISFSVDFNGLLIVLLVVQLLLIALFCEVIPNDIAGRKKESVLKKLVLIVRPFISLVNPLSVLLGKFSKSQSKTYSGALSGEEFSDVIEIAEGGEDLETETQMLKGLVRFSDLDVKEIMKSRLDIVAIEWNFPLEKVLKIAAETGYSRIPVYEDNMDNVKGILYVKDLLAYIGNKSEFDWHNHMRSPFFTPESKALSDLLNEFQMQKIHLAIVVDQYGGTSGLVTLEDIIEEIVGEIVDEYDHTDTKCLQLNENTYSFEAKTSLVDFCKIIGLGDDSIFEDVRGNSDSLAGLILELEGKIPPKDSDVVFKNFTFHIEDADSRKINRITVTIENRTEDEE